MNDRPTPETDAFSVKFKSICGSKAWVPTDICRRLERERDEAREALADWENAAAHVEANHPDEVHCGCVPVLRKLLTDARKERDVAREDLEFRRGLYKVLEEANNRLRTANEEAVALARTLKQERDELRVARNECERQFQEKVAENIALLDERDETREALRRAKRFVEAFEPRSRGAEIDQNETLNIISKVLDLLYGGDSLS